MSKEKLISLIILKETYKDTKPYLTDLAANKQAAAKVSAQAIKQILTTDYIAQAKLYAVRYLKDSFEKGNTLFIDLVESSILTILLGIAVDEGNEKAVTKYAGSSYTKSDELAKFKSILSSLFRMAKECILKWAEWVPDAGRRFASAAGELRKKGVALDFQYKYFRPENDDLFRGYVKKNGGNSSPAPKKSGGNSVPQVKVPQVKVPQVKAPQVKKKKDPLVQNVEFAMQRIEGAKNQQELQKLQNNFNQALNTYLEQSVNYKDEQLQKMFEQFQNKKTEVLKRIKSSKKQGQAQSQSQKPKQSAGVVTPMGQNNKQKDKAAQPPKVQPNKSNTDKISTQKKNQSLGAKSGNVQFSVSSKQTSNNTGEPLAGRKQNESLGSGKASNLQSKLPSEQVIKKQPIPAANSSGQSKKQEPKKVDDPKPPTSASKIPKGPLMFDDDQEQVQPPKAQRRARPNVAQNKSPRADPGKNPKPIEQPKQSKINIDIKPGSKPVEQSRELKSSPDVKVSSSSIPQVKPGSRPSAQSSQLKGNTDNKAAVTSKDSRNSQSKLRKDIADEKKASKLGEMSISKESDRVDFSQQEDSEMSEEIVHRDMGNFKRKVNLAEIQEVSDSHVTDNKSSHVQGLRSPRDEQIFNKKNNAANTANKLLQENKVLFQKIQKIAKELQHQRSARQNAEKQKQHLLKEISGKTEDEEKFKKKINKSVPIEDYNKLKKQLEDERADRASLKAQMAKLGRQLEDQRSNRVALSDQNTRLRIEQQSLIEQLNQTKQRLQGVSFREEKSKVGAHPSYEVQVQSRVASQRASQRPGPSAPIKREQVDEDYINNLTHPSNMHAWLNQVNVSLFKRNVLGQSQIFYRDDYLTVLSSTNVYTQNNQQFLSVQLTYQLKAIKQAQLQVRYRNCQQLDLWTKPMAGEHPLYTQDLVIKLHRSPIKIMKAEVKIVEGLTVRLLLPFMYWNFLREEAFSEEQFEEVFAAKGEQAIRSKVTQLNSGTVKEAGELIKLFKNAVGKDGRLKFCMAEGISDQVFMGQFESLRSNKVILRILPIPNSEDMIVKARELMECLIFLIS